MLNLLLLAPLPYPEADRLVRVFGTTPQAGGQGFTPVAYQALRDAHPPFDPLAGFLWWGATLTEPDRPAEVLVSLRVSPEFLSTLAVPPLPGRWFAPEEDVPGSVVIILTERLWRCWFNGDSSVIGRTVRMDGQTVTVVGVMPERMAAPIVFDVFEVLRPMALTESERTSRAGRWMHLVARLRPQQSLPAARAEMAGMVGALFVSRLLASRMLELPAANTGVQIGVVAAPLGAALAACGLPARRAMRVDPVTRFARSSPSVPAAQRLAGRTARKMTAVRRMFARLGSRRVPLVR